MNSQISALKAEFIKTKHAKIFLISFITFALVPVMGGFFMLVLQNPETAEKASLLNAKMEAMNVTADWDAQFMIVTQGIGIGGIMVFGFIISWIFGREYSDGTVKDLLALPVSRIKILNAKFIMYFFWSFALAFSNLLFGILLGIVLRLPGFESHIFLMHLQEYGITSLLTVLLGTPIAFFAMWGKGYLAPLGCVALVLVFSQIIAAVGYGHYFPWAVPALYSGAGGEYKAQLNGISYLMVLLTAVAGYYAATVYWKYADQTK
jgi:ABC-2 type transport system permease protein